MNSKFVKKLVFAGIDSSPNFDLSIYDKPLTFISEADNSLVRIDQDDFWQSEAAWEEGREWDPWGDDGYWFGNIFYRMNENSEYQKYQGEDLVLNKNSYVQFNINPENTQNNETSWPFMIDTLSENRRDCYYRRFSTGWWNSKSLFSCEGNVSSIIGYGYLWEIFQRM